MQKIPFYFLLLAVVIFFPIRTVAASQSLLGYVYSENAGWISLSCANTNSCNNISYGVLQDEKGNLAGYGYSQTVGWINFNPNYGGISINSDGSFSGWAYPQTQNWLRIESAKVISANELQSSVASLQDAMKNDSGNKVASQSTMSLLDSLCKKFFSASQCAW